MAGPTEEQLTTMYVFMGAVSFIWGFLRQFDDDNKGRR